MTAYRRPLLIGLCGWAVGVLGAYLLYGGLSRGLVYGQTPFDARHDGPKPASQAEATAEGVYGWLWALLVAVLEQVVSTAAGSLAVWIGLRYHRDADDEAAVPST